MEHKLTDAQVTILAPHVERQMELRAAMQESQAAINELAGLIAAKVAGGANPRFERRAGVWYLVSDAEQGEPAGEAG